MMIRCKVASLGMALLAFGLSTAWAQQENPDPAIVSGGELFLVGKEQTQPQLEWLVLNMGVDSGSGMGLTALDDLARSQLKLPRGEGLLVASLAPDCSAARAGVAQHDIFLSLAGVPLKTPADLETQLKAAGEKSVPLELLHLGHKKTLLVQPRVFVTFGPVAKTTSSWWIGVQVAAVEPALRAQMSLPADRGLVTTEVVPDSPAAKGGLKVHDILLSVEGTPLRDQNSLVQAVRKQEEKTAAVEIIREGEHLKLEVTPQKRSSSDLHLTGERLSKDLNIVYPGQTFTSLYAPPSLFRTHGGSSGGGTSLTWTAANGAGSTEKRLEALDGEVKSLRKAVEELTRALKDKK